MKRIILILSFFIVSFNYLMACDCILKSIEHHTKLANNIIIVKVIKNLDTLMTPNLAVLDYSKGYTAYVEVCKILKGKFKENQKIRIDSKFTNCSIIFKKNQKYLLFISESENDGLYTDECSYSGKLLESKKNIRKIKKAIRRLDNRIVLK